MESILTISQTDNILVKAIIVIIGYFATFFITNLLIKKIVLKGKTGANVDIDKKTIRDGYIIGKCENIIILSFVLAGEVTGLALIFAAKSLARQKDINDNAVCVIAPIPIETRRETDHITTPIAMDTDLQEQ